MSEQGLETFEDHPIVYSNFEGRATDFNPAGTRTFCLVLTPEEAADMASRRWNIKRKEPSEHEGAEGFDFLQVKCGFQGYKPPVIVMITSKGHTILSEDMVAILDSVDIKQFDCVLRPYDHNSGMGTGRAAYLKTAYITIDEDPLMMKYGFQVGAPKADIPVGEDAF